MINWTDNLNSAIAEFDCCVRAKPFRVWFAVCVAAPDSAKIWLLDPNESAAGRPPDYVWPATSVDDAKGHVARMLSKRDLVHAPR